jgi:hypothetical protein
MSRKTFVFLVVIAVFVCVITITRTQVNSITNTNQSTGFSNLTLQISSSKTRYVKLEPIPIGIGLKNGTANSVNFSTVLGLGPYLSLSVRNENNEEVQLQGNMLLPGYALITPASYTLSPNEVRQKQELLADSLEKMFPRSGRYTIQISLIDSSNERITSDPLTIEINEPQGIDRQAYNYIKGTIEPVQNRARIREMVQLQQYFVDNFRGSVYVKYVAVKLAGAYQALGEHGKAERELCRVKNINFFFSDHINRTLEKLNAKLRPVTPIRDMPEDAPVPPLPRPCTNNP